MRKRYVGQHRIEDRDPDALGMSPWKIEQAQRHARAERLFYGVKRGNTDPRYRGLHLSSVHRFRRTMVVVGFIRRHWQMIGAIIFGAMGGVFLVWYWSTVTFK